MSRVRVSFKVDVPVGASMEEVTDWLRFECHDNGELSRNNPLIDREVEPVRGTFEVEPPWGWATPSKEPKP